MRNSDGPGLDHLDKIGRLRKIKKVSRWGVIAGLIIAVLSCFTGIWAEKELIKLDHDRLDQVRLEE